MGEYLVILPSRIPEQLFSSLNNVHDGIKTCIRETYRGLDRIGITSAETPIRAVRQIIARQADTRKVNIKSLLKMFERYATNCIFNVPKRDSYDSDGNKLREGLADTFHGMELAIQIADCLGRLDHTTYRPETFHSKAFTLLEESREKRAAYSSAYGRQ